MKSTLTVKELSDYISTQCKHFFPDNICLNKYILESSVQKGFEWADYCFSHIKSIDFSDGDNTLFNHMHTDQYSMFLTKLSNIAWFEFNDVDIAVRIMYLNKVLHGINCMYDNKMPDIYYFRHAALGATIGKATFNDYLVLAPHITIGAHYEKFPVLGKGVILGSGSMIIGPCKIGNRVSVSIATDVFKTDIPNDSIAFRDSNGKLIIRKSNKEFFGNIIFNNKIED